MDRDLKMLRSQHILIQRGRGKHSSNDGNKFLESVISDYREEYQLLTPSNTPARTKIVDAIVDRIQKDNRRFLTRTTKNEWVEAQNHSIRNLIRRKLNAPGQLASLGGIKSTIDATFMLNHPELESDVFEILRSLFDHPSQSPECSGEHGIRLSADSVYGNKPEINTKKKMYLRQSFGKTDCGLPTHNKNTRTTCAYGVGTGVVSHGQIREHVAIRPFTTGMQRIADAIQDYIKTADPGGTVDVEAELNTLEVVVFYEQKKIVFHRDQCRDKNGRFLHNKNSQKYNTFTCILVVGDDRDLKMQLFDQYKTRVFGPQTSKVFNFKHGSLFLLHPDDEADLVREMFGLPEKTYFMHKNDGVKEDGQLSIGLVFRACIARREVVKGTGQLVLDEKDLAVTRKPKFSRRTGKVVRFMKKEKISVLSEFLKGEKKEEMDRYLSRLYQKMERKYYGGDEKKRERIVPETNKLPMQSKKRKAEAVATNETTRSAKASRNDLNKGGKYGKEEVAADHIINDIPSKDSPAPNSMSNRPSSKRRHSSSDSGAGFPPSKKSRGATLVTPTVSDKASCIAKRTHSHVDHEVSYSPRRKRIRAMSASQVEDDAREDSSHEKEDKMLEINMIPVAVAGGVHSDANSQMKARSQPREVFDVEDDMSTTAEEAAPPMKRKRSLKRLKSNLYCTLDGDYWMKAPTRRVIIRRG
jgi:hypothetical protein